MELKLHITLQKPPAGVDFCLQKGSGSNFENVGIQRSGSGDLVFEVPVETKGDPKKDAIPDFKGPYVEGPVMGRFVYIRIGQCAGQVSEWSRRLKVPLRDISWEMVSGENVVLKTTVPGTAKDGGPNCATVKPFSGWDR